MVQPKVIQRKKEIHIHRIWLGDVRGCFFQTFPSEQHTYLKVACLDELDGSELAVGTVVFPTSVSSSVNQKRYH